MLYVELKLAIAQGQVGGALKNSQAHLQNLYIQHCSSICTRKVPNYNKYTTLVSHNLLLCLFI